MVTRRQQVQRGWGTYVLILLAVLAISASVATRTFHAARTDSSGAYDGSAGAKHQLLDADAFVLADPVPQLTMLLPVAAPHAPPPELPFRTLELTESLFNRPPPSLSLL